MTKAARNAIIEEVASYIESEKMIPKRDFVAEHVRAMKR